MSLVMKRFTKGVVLKGITDETTIASLDGEGALFQNSSDLRLKAYIEGSVRQIVTNSQSQVLTNKTIDADNNTVSNIETDNLKAGVLNTSTSLTGASNTQIPSALAVKTYIDNGLAGQNDASEITVSPTIGGFTGNVQATLQGHQDLIDDLVTLSGVSANAENLGAFTGITIPDNQTVKQALQALETAHEEVDQNANDLISLSGVAENSANLGVFTGTTIPDNQTIKQALQALETSQEEIDQNANDLITLSGVAENATSLGSFTGTTIPDNQTIKQALQALETEVEGKLDIGNINATSIADGSVDNTEFQYLNGVTSAIQTQLDAKTDESGGSLTNGSIVTPSRLDVKQDTFANLQTYAATASNGQLVFATDLKQTYQIIDGALKVVGGAGGINYIGNSDFESGTTGYATYADAAGLAPVDGTGGTANTTFTATSVSPLRGTKSGLITKNSGASRQGEGVSYNFTIDAADQAQVLRISFDYSTSTDYADGEIRVYVYDVTNSRLIEVIDRDLLASTQGKFVGTFQSSPDSLSYRLILHIADTDTTQSWTVEIDNIIVGPQTIVKGAIVTDSESTTLTSLIKGTTTNPTFGTLSDNRFFWSRRGENLIVRGGLLQTTAGTAGSGNYVIDLPSGLKIDGFKTTSSNSGGMGTVGSILIWDGATYYTGVITADASANQLNVWFGDELLSPNRWSSANVPFSSTNLRISFSAEVPIKGWSSNVVLSEDAGNREIYARLDMNNVNQNATAIGQTLVALSNASEDTTGSFDSATSLWTCPESGLYDIIGSIYATGVTTTDNNACSIRINGSGVFATFNQPGNSTAANTIVCSITYRLQKGDTVGLAYTSQTDAAYVINGNTGRTFLSIAKRSSPQTIAASEVVAAHYTSNSGQTITTGGSGVTLIYEDLIQDTHNAYNISTGDYTIPQTGWYKASASARMNQDLLAVGTLFTLFATLDGVNIMANGEGARYVGVARYGRLVSGEFYASKGQIFRMVGFQNSGASKSLEAVAGINFFSIAKINGVS